jgi:hypothetical protein
VSLKHRNFAAQEACIWRQFEALGDRAMKFVPLNCKLRMDASISRRIKADCAMDSTSDYRDRWHDKRDIHYLVEILNKLRRGILNWGSTLYRGNKHSSLP